MRGAVLIGEGVHELSAPLRISVSGVVIRGVSKHKTILHKTGVDRGAVVYIEGKNDLTVTDTLRVTDDYVPVGSHTLALSGGARLAEGSRLIIVRPSTKEWIESIGCEVFGGNLSYWGWKAGEMDVRWQRTVTSVTSSTPSSANIVIDAPLSVSLDKEWGGAYVLAYSWPGLIHDCGVENITIEAGSLSPVDENHAWEGVYIISLDATESDSKNAGKLMLLLSDVMKDVFPDNQVVYAVHTNTENLHIHFIINTVGLNGVKIQDRKSVV